ncbi:hypothetical protein BDF20DRAFT_883834 [Mycotypha africana]|uniref:uncharacterized protein n=1 Tax=Mycotypha africana TaxID=64632 RepID=UPI0023001FC9|nr:uncharacterized protein BDF20DRAFT_883834 [Mycotypha africana]KAI8973727.1 hypothetical protein BDF20DRAFT_883834 [Mycotypha africana]
MLPQFGYIVAQAGADSQPPTPNSVPPPTPNSSNNTSSSAIIHHLAKPYNSSKSNNEHSNTSQQTALPSNDRGSGLLPPPPPLPYMYPSQQLQQQQHRDSSEDYANRYAGAPASPSVPLYQQPSSVQHSQSYDLQQQQQQQNSSFYRPLQPLPPIQTATTVPTNQNNSSSWPWSSSQQQLPNQQLYPSMSSIQVRPQQQQHLQLQQQQLLKDSNSNRDYGPLDLYTNPNHPENTKYQETAPSISAKSSAVWQPHTSDPATPPHLRTHHMASQPSTILPPPPSSPANQLVTTDTSPTLPSIYHRNTEQQIVASPPSPPHARPVKQLVDLSHTPARTINALSSVSNQSQKQEQHQQLSTQKGKSHHQLVVLPEPIEAVESKMLRKMREFNDLITWMDNEFWEQCDEIYREKLQSLQEEIKTIQDGKA